MCAPDFFSIVWESAFALHFVVDSEVFFSEILLCLSSSWLGVESFRQTFVYGLFVPGVDFHNIDMIANKTQSDHPTWQCMSSVGFILNSTGKFICYLRGQVKW